MATTNTLILSVKLVLISAGVVFIAMLLTLSFPQLLNSAASELPSFWSSIRSWLRPPYLYVIINGIIITIAASSRLHYQYHKSDTSYPLHHIHNQHAAAEIEYAAKVTPPPVTVLPADHVNQVARAVDADRFLVHYDADVVKDFEIVADRFLAHYEADVVKDDEVVAYPPETTAFHVSDPPVPEQIEMEKDDDKCVVTVKAVAVVNKATSTPPRPRPIRQDSSEIVSEFFMSMMEKPAVSATARFGHHRRPVKSVPEVGKALRVAKPKPKRQETLESTWKAITEGRHVPLTRHLKKSDTWESHSRQINSADPPSPQLVKKSETFNDRASYSALPPPPPPSLGKLKKDPSLSQDELNRRVEAFISKFNEDMRLQRQQSIQQYKEMINRGA